MNQSSQGLVRSSSAAIGRRAMELFRDAAPKILFFFVAFMLLFLLFKLFVTQYSIEFSVFTEAAVAALVLGKLIPLLDWMQSGYRFERHRRIVVIVGKTLIYALAVILLGIGDRIVKACLKQGSWRGGISALKADANLDRFLGLVLLITLVVGAYLTLQEINRALGKQVLFRLLFERPVDTKGSSAARSRELSRPHN
jgi:hypothetical protein